MTADPPVALLALLARVDLATRALLPGTQDAVFAMVVEAWYANTGLNRDGGHDYLSTSCLHAGMVSDPDEAAQLHGLCGKAQHDRNEGGEPRCKTCPAPCRCQCHREV